MKPLNKSDARPGAMRANAMGLRASRRATREPSSQTAWGFPLCAASEGKHYLEGQRDGENFIGISLVKP